MIDFKPPKTTKTLITDCFGLDLYMIPNTAILAKGEHNTIITKPNTVANLHISADDHDTDKVIIRVDHNSNVITQTIDLARKFITFGLRRYLVCDCGQRVNSLYLKHGHFACRHCHNLAYEVSRLRKGTFSYRLNRLDKIESAKHQVRNISYGDISFTRKARQVMALANKLS